MVDSSNIGRTPSDQNFVKDVISLGTYRDRVICHSYIVGGGHRFYGFRVLRFAQLKPILEKYQMKILFTNSGSTDAIEIEARTMTHNPSVSDVLDPKLLTKPPHNLKLDTNSVNAGAVSRWTYKWDTASITDNVLHRLCSHPTVLDCRITSSQLHVYVMHDRNIYNGLMHYLSYRGKNSNQKWTRNKRTCGKQRGSQTEK